MFFTLLVNINLQTYINSKICFFNMLIFNYEVCIQITTKASVKIKPNILLINESTHFCICNQFATTPIFIFLENAQQSILK